MSAPNLFSGMGAHESAASNTNDWLTPRYILDALGEFDLDPCTPLEQPWPTARHRYTRADNGLMQPWFGRVWLNPPYSQDLLPHFMRRMAEHNRGTALIFARTETEVFFSTVWNRAAAVHFFAGRLTFHTPDGRLGKGNAGAPSVLCAYGQSDADILAECGLPGRFVPLLLPRGLVVVALEQTWLQAVNDYLTAQRGPVRLDALYRHFARHPKAGRNPNFKAKIRQTLQLGPFARVERGVWTARKEGRAE